MTMGSMRNALVVNLRRELGDDDPLLKFVAEREKQRAAATAIGPAK